MEKRETLCCWVSPATELTGQSQAFRNLGDGSQGAGGVSAPPICLAPPVCASKGVSAD